MRRPSRPTALAGAAVVLAAGALAVSITTAAAQPPTPPASAFYVAPGAVPELTVNIACAPGKDTGTATVTVGAHISGAAWQEGSLTDSPSTGSPVVHRFSEIGKSATGWMAPYPIAGHGNVRLASPQPWVGTGGGAVAYNCSP